MTTSTPVGVLLVAGIGQRLRPFTDRCPKALLEVGPESLLARAVRLLLAAGVEELVLATGYLEEPIRAAMEGCPVPVRYCRNEEFDRTQNSVSLWICRDAIGPRSFFKADGDLLFHPEVLSRLATPEEPLAVAVDRSGAVGGPLPERPLGAEEMKVVANEYGKIKAFGKHLDPIESYGESIGLERIDQSLTPLLFAALQERIQQGQTDLYYEDIYSDLIATHNLHACAVDTTDLPWAEIDTMEDLTQARALLSSGALG